MEYQLTKIETMPTGGCHGFKQEYSAVYSSGFDAKPRHNIEVIVNSIDQLKEELTQDEMLELLGLKSNPVVYVEEMTP